MDTARLLTLVIVALLLFSCGDSDLLEDYMVQRPRVLAIQVEAPEAGPAEEISMRLLVGGAAVDQQMDAAVAWYLEDEPPELLGTAGYDEALSVGVPAGILEDGSSWVDLSVLASLEIGTKTYYGEKIVRITETPVGKNPIIDGIDITYRLADEPVTDQVSNGEQLTLSSQVRNVALTAAMQALAAAENDSLVFRWYVTTSKNSAGKLYINVDKHVIHELLGPAAKASETKASAVFSLRGKDADGSFQSGFYDVYLVVRDNATAPQSAADDRFGTAFFYFTLCLGDTCPSGE